jgi:hypothetical protein
LASSSSRFIFVRPVRWPAHDQHAISCIIPLSQ